MKDHTHADTEKRDNANPGGHMSNQQSRNDTNSSTVGLKRRRLLKGAALVPAIFTLQTGSARAMVSSYRCIGNTKSQPDKPFTVGDDKWHNEKVKNDTIKVQHVDSSKTAVLIVGSNGLSFYDISRRLWAEAGRADDGFRLFTPDGGTTVYKEVVGKPKVYARVYVNNEGDVMKIGSNSSRYKAVYDSCWSSFR